MMDKEQIIKSFMTNFPFPILPRGRRIEEVLSLSRASFTFSLARLCF
jgi:hypothetical protein